MENVILPELGEGIKSATIACWCTSVGDEVSKDDDIVELVTDKATFHVSAGTTGVIKEVRFKQGDEARIGEVLAVIEPRKL